MYGILILFHPDLRRIITDYGFNNFPLRKDFPLSGFVEVIYSDYIKNLDYRDVELMQEMRPSRYRKHWTTPFMKSV
jgi:NADH-quinone oxidoreductase subunit C